MEEDIIKLFLHTEDSIGHISTLPLDDINEVLTAKERRRMYVGGKSDFLKNKDTSGYRVSPNSPLAATIIEDKVIDMLLFLTFRYTKAFANWKALIPKEETYAQHVANAKTTKATTAGDASATLQGSMHSAVPTERTGTVADTSTGQMGILKKKKRAQNLVLQRMTKLLRTLLYEMHSYSTPMAPFVKDVIEFVTKFFVGEEFCLGSDQVLTNTTVNDEPLKRFLNERSFFRKEEELKESFKSDNVDKNWFLEQKGLTFLDKSNHWSIELHSEAGKIFRDAITESGLGQSCYPVLNDYIGNVSNSFESSKIFSKQMNQLSLSFLIPMERTSAYYNELTPLAECLARLNSPNLETAGKRCSLAMIRSVF